MSRPVITIKQNTPLSEIQAAMVREDIGRLPVLDEEGRIKGLVTRKELLQTLFGDQAGGESQGALVAEERRVHFQGKLEQLKQSTRWLFREMGAIAEGLDMQLYAVGGCVRDLFLGRPNFDLDFVVEGSAQALAEALAGIYPGRFGLLAQHDRFQTATLQFFAEEKREIDVSTARIEFYEHPAALPTVEASGLEQDLFRRDFTINALAVCLNPPEYGEVIDFFDGASDLEHRIIRILHPFSFIEDPTRIIRAARFAARLGFVLEERTRRQAERAIAIGIFDNLGGFRLKEELKLILEAPQRLATLDLLNDLGGGLRYLASNLVYNESVRSAMRRADRLLSRNPLKDCWVVYLGTMLSGLEHNDLEGAMDRLCLANEEREWIRSGLHLTEQLGVPQMGPAPLRSELYGRLHGQSNHALAIAASLAAPGSPTRRWIKLYLDELKDVKVALSGHDLIRIGFSQGPMIREALTHLHKARLDGSVQTPAQELEFIKKHYPHIR
jgi:tRNA nucleotidyltransferase (CCA-adding enzyme)